MMAARQAPNLPTPPVGAAEKLERWGGGGLTSDLPEAWRGGFAIDVLAPKRAQSLAFIGILHEAESYLLAAMSLRDFTDIRVYGPQPVAAAELVRRVGLVSRKSIRLCATAEEAQKGADVLIFAGRNAARMMVAELISDRAHISYLLTTRQATLDIEPQILRSVQRVAMAHKGLVDWPAAAGIKQPLLIDDLASRYNPDRMRGRTLYIDRVKQD